MKILLFLTLSVFLSAVSAKHFALLVAGSSSWYNYRHQADVCHSYQVLHNHGIPDEQIVVMMYDDIAQNPSNKFPGKIINKPGGGDVYKNVPKDYTHRDVTPENFLKILQGDKEAMKGIGSGKVIESGPDDNVFVYFADHGAPNIIAFPHEELHAADLNEAIKNMHTQKKYKKMVFYIEACESGSMFSRHKLATNINVFATTAANGAESSYACYWSRSLQTYLGDVYSVKWLENSDKANFNTETLSQQFKVVKKETNTSHVMEFGDLTMGNMVLEMFQGGAAEKYTNLTKATPPVSTADAVPSPDVPLMILKHRYTEAQSEIERAEAAYLLEREISTRSEIRETMKKVVEKLVGNPLKQKKLLSKKATPYMEKCYKEAVTKFRKTCFDYNKYEHALRHIYVLANLCDEGLATKDILRAMEKVCWKRN